MFLFDASSPIPLHCTLVAPEEPRILASTFVTSKSRSDLLLLRSNYQFTLVTQESPVTKDKTVPMIIHSSHHKPQEKSKLFSNMFGPSKLVEGLTTVVSAIRPTGIDKALSFLDSPSFMAPPPLTFVESFLETLLDAKVKATEKQKVDKEMSEPLEMQDVDSESHQVNNVSEEKVQVPELDTLVDLFKQQQISEMSAKKESHTKKALPLQNTPTSIQGKPTQKEAKSRNLKKEKLKKVRKVQ